MLKFRKDTEVVTLDQESVGKIDSVIVDPRTNEVSHVIVREGMLLPEDKIFNVNLFQEATDDRAVLATEIEDYNALPRYDQQFFVPMPQASGTVIGGANARPLLWYPPTFNTATKGDFPLSDMDDDEWDVSRVTLEEGARVIAKNGNDVGHIASIILDDTSQKITHIAVEHEMFGDEEKLIPVQWIKDINNEYIRLAVDEDVFETLASYEPA